MFAPRIARAASFRMVWWTMLAFAISVPAVGRAQVARMEIHAFPSTTLTDQEFLVGRKDGTPVTLAGELRLPRPGKERMPAVVLLHVSGGIGASVIDWAQYLNELGVATFLIDSYTARGIVSTVNDQSQLGRLAMTVDAYAALEMLAKDPRIDPSRIALMGFSRGAHSALYASMKRFQRMHGPAAQEFAAFIAFYSDCGTTYREDEELADKPIRLFHGSADDYNPVASCRAYVERLNRKGKNVQLTEYANAGHLFDGPAFRTALKIDKGQTPRRCERAEAQDGVIINTRTKQPFSYADPCVEYGPTVAFNESAYAESRKAVREFVLATLRPR